MRLTVVGCSGSYPGAGNPASCYLVEADGFRVVLDMGIGAMSSLLHHVDPEHVDAVLLSHLHADHCVDLVGLHVALRHHPDGPRPPVAVHGPAATVDVMAAVVAAGGDEVRARRAVTEQLAVTTWADGATYRVGPFDVRVRRVVHPVEAYALRLEHGGRALVYSGDTAPCDALVEIAAGADLLLCEAAFHDGRDDGVSGLHLNGREAAEHATRAGVRRLVLTHLPPWNDPARTLAEAGPAYPGAIEIARVGSTYEL